VKQSAIRRATARSNAIYVSRGTLQFASVKYFSFVEQKIPAIFLSRVLAMQYTYSFSVTRGAHVHQD
jgi:hypothetical protein